MKNFLRGLWFRTFWHIAAIVCFFLVIFVSKIATIIEQNFGIKAMTTIKGLGLAFIFVELYLIYRMRKRSSGKMEGEEDSAEKVNYSEVPHSTEGDAPKPIDKTGNVFLHNEETLTEDMANIGIDRYKENEKK